VSIIFDVLRFSRVMQEEQEKLPVTTPLKVCVSQGQRDNHQEPVWHHHHHAHPQSRQKQTLEMVNPQVRTI
jgi:hypothetical protein